MFRSKIERDPSIKKLEQDVFAKMQEIAQPLQPKREETSDVQFVSFADAIKELSEIRRSN